MLEIAIALIVGFALGYGVRASGFPTDGAERRDCDVVFRAASVPRPFVIWKRRTNAAIFTNGASLK
jgi:hypothetical protein